MTFSKWPKYLAAAAVALAAATPAWSQYSKMVVFGDSMSDTHRYYELSKVLFGEGYPSAPSMPGRFCDGPVAVEYLAKNLGLNLQNYAVAGAQSGYSTLALIPLGVLTQINEHLNDNAIVPTITTVPVVSTITTLLPGTGRADPKALYFLWTGPDDFYAIGGMNALTPYFVMAHINQAVTSLYDAGARYFFIPTMPDLSITPSAAVHEKQTPGYIATAAKLSEQFSGVMTKGINDLRARYPKARIMSFDTMTFLKTEREKARLEGKNVVDACHPGGLAITSSDPTPPCPDPENHLFWDSNHPTTVANKILADAWTKSVVYKP
jgi:phospholipase/lecithinase/hemolysin